jgi:hypothetical protein
MRATGRWAGVKARVRSFLLHFNTKDERGPPEGHGK